MLRNTFFAVLAVLGLATASQAALVGQFNFVESRSIDNAVFMGDVDLWTFDINNTGSDMATSVELSFSGGFMANADLAFQPTAELPKVFGFDVPDSFFVLPGTPLQVDTVDSETQLSSSFTRQGGGSILDAGATTTIAFFSVAPGVQLGMDNFVSGRAAVLGVFEDISYLSDGELPGIELSFGGSLVASGDTVDLGTALQGAAFQHTFSIENTGAADLVLGAPTVGGSFLLDGAFPTTIAAGDTADFVLAADTSNLGPLSGMLSFGTNVGDLETFSVNLSGQVVPEPSTFALAGLALVGLVGFARRRK